MTHLAWEEVAEGLQARAEARCAADGHAWESVEDVGYVCRWCMAISDEATRPSPDWRQRALSHATALRAMLIVKAPPGGTAGAAWLAEAEETFELAEIKPGVGVR